MFFLLQFWDLVSKGTGAEICGRIIDAFVSDGFGSRFDSVVCFGALSVDHMPFGQNL
jgi:hypothetical protein